MSPAPRRVQDIHPKRLALLNAGKAEASTLTECLAVDFATLMRSAVPEVGEDALSAIGAIAGSGISKRMALAAGLIRDQLGDGAVTRLRQHRSDAIRGWACFMVGANAALTLAERLAAIRPFADDPHFGVREWAWMAVRPHLAADLRMAVALLADWTGTSSDRLRRFASEATRPRGVWCSHIPTLKRNPEMALTILEPLNADPSLYVQDSVGNWLNDAAKDRPDWVRDLCASWQRDRDSAATTRICKRALRSID
ncbi:DNA alkylation repair protein [Ensifer canadensis]